MLTQLQKDFIKRVDDLRAFEGWRNHEAMHYFLSASFHAMKKPTLIGQDALDCEAEYMRIVEMCQKPDKTMGAISEMMGMVVMGLGDSLADFIGPVFMELCADQRMGQFFTPDSVCYLSAEMVLSNVQKVIDEQGFVTLDEPACGSGGMTLAACRWMKDQGINYQQQAFFRLTDLDQDCFMASYIQATLAGMCAQLFQANTLTLEVRQSAQTVWLMMNPWPKSPRVRNIKEKLAPSPTGPIQLSLFEEAV